MPNVASQIVAVATEADYRVDPTRWGSTAVAAHFPGLRFGRLLAGQGRRQWVFD